MSKKDYLNYDDVYESFLSLYKDVINEYGYDYNMWQDEAEEYAAMTAGETLDSMRRYVHQNDTRMCSNFCNIREDWEYCHDFIGSEVKPWGRFDDVVKSIDGGTISDENLAKFHKWALDWFFVAFGTFGLKYNFGEYLSEIEYDREREMEDAA